MKKSECSALHLKVVWLLLLCFHCSTIALSQNPHDSLVYLQRSDTLVAIRKPLLPLSDQQLRGTYIDTNTYPELFYGSVCIYNRLDQLEERFIFGNGIRIRSEHFSRGELIWTNEFNPTDSVWVVSDFDHGQLISKNVASRECQIETNWHPNGQLKSRCATQNGVSSCVRWDQSGNLVERIPCQCPHSIGASPGDSPALTFSFACGSMVAICGNETENEYSEFEVIECKHGKPISTYEATQTCSLSFHADTLSIFELHYLPCGPDWTWESTPLSVDHYVCIDDTVVALPSASIRIKPAITHKQQEEFVSSLKRDFQLGSHPNEEWETIIAKLEVAALAGTSGATDLLAKLPAVDGLVLDGGLKEQYDEAIATVRWNLGGK